MVSYEHFEQTLAIGEVVILNSSLLIISADSGLTVVL